MVQKAGFSIASKQSFSDMDTLLDMTVQILDQLQIGIGSLSDDNYTHSKNGESSIGAHTRHIIEFYNALFMTLNTTKSANAQQKKYAQLCYDDRPRNHDIEASKTVALEKLNDIKEQVDDVKKSVPSNENTELIEIACVVCPDSPMFTMKTTMQRELFYLLDHMIHHMALIKKIARDLDVSFDGDFGLAQSTKKYEKSID